ncbi:hypothetical protein [Alkalimarinus alittae]|uniref:Uncharacterized protein n=1 Tax=Alkalimarinus alittae TaxID=2961619 RepID=A0ABY6MXR4_9ALTE|nr:hypothetical protein [Alkalimarinus alittae]UZE94590.1 hypothetical protein NKI27_10875 [Alkalimarinus alittae]
MSTKENTNIPRKAFVIFISQVIAWLLILTPFFEDFSASNDAAGAGMAGGLSILFVVFPCMAFVFVTSFYYFKKNIPTRFRVMSAFNYLGLFLVLAVIY